jgi:hypothetical protein
MSLKVCGSFSLQGHFPTISLQVLSLAQRLPQLTSLLPASSLSIFTGKIYRAAALPALTQNRFSWPFVQFKVEENHNSEIMNLDMEKSTNGFIGFFTIFVILFTICGCYHLICAS